MDWPIINFCFDCRQWLLVARNLQGSCCYQNHNCVKLYFRYLSAFRNLLSYHSLYRRISRIEFLFWSFFSMMASSTHEIFSRAYFRTFYMPGSSYSHFHPIYDERVLLGFFQFHYFVKTDYAVSLLIPFH